MPEESKKPEAINYQSNSHKSKAKKPVEPEEGSDRQPQEKIAQAGVVQRKKPLGTKFKEMFTGDDLHSVWEYLLYEIAIPAVKTMASDMASQGTERLLFGETTSRRNQHGGRRPGYTNYNTISSNGGREKRELSQRARASHDFNEIVMADRGEAERVIDKLVDVISSYDVARISDLYDLVGITGSFVDDKWGWFDLRGAGVKRVRDGFLLVLPPTQPID